MEKKRIRKIHDILLAVAHWFHVRKSLSLYDMVWLGFSQVKHTPYGVLKRFESINAPSVFAEASSQNLKVISFIIMAGATARYS